MTKLTILGTASAVPTSDHLNTHFAIQGTKSTILVDCIGNQTIRLEQAGIEIDQVNDIILTHCHPDHISGVPAFLMSLWLLGRRSELCLHGLPQSLNCVNRMMDLYQWETWPDFFPVKFIEIPPNSLTPVIENNEFRVISSPVNHLVPTIGLRVESLGTGKVIAYSCDTEPCLQVEQLAEDADILLHEATGNILGHTSAAQAGEVAEKSRAKSLYLIHYHPHEYQSQEMIFEASKKFSGEVKFTRDLMEFEF